MAKIPDLLGAGPTLSFEFSAPRDEPGRARLTRTLKRLAALEPSFRSVTYGAAGAARGPTSEVVEYIQHRLGVTAMPHLTCVSHTRSEVATLLDRYRELGIENLLALRGDLPREAGEPESGHFRLASELVAVARAHSDFAIGVAAHPEMHPPAASFEADPEHQGAQIEPAASAHTQFFCRVEYAARFTAAIDARRSHGPCRPGIMPPTNPDNIARMAAMNRTDFPDDLRDRLLAAGDDLAVRREIGIETATALADNLLKVGAPGLHIYTLNFSQIALEVVRRLRLRPEARA